MCEDGADLLTAAPHICPSHTAAGPHTRHRDSATRQINMGKWHLSMVGLSRFSCMPRAVLYQRHRDITESVHLCSRFSCQPHVDLVLCQVTSLKTDMLVWDAPVCLGDSPLVLVGSLCHVISGVFTHWLLLLFVTNPTCLYGRIVSYGGPALETHSWAGTTYCDIMTSSMLHCDNNSAWLLGRSLTLSIHYYYYEAHLDYNFLQSDPTVLQLMTHQYN